MGSEAVPRRAEQRTSFDWSRGLRRFDMKGGRKARKMVELERERDEEDQSKKKPFFFGFFLFNLTCSV